MEADRQQFAKVALLDYIWFRNGLPNETAMIAHLRMTSQNMLPPFFGKSNRDAVA